MDSRDMPGREKAKGPAKDRTRSSGNHSTEVTKVFVTFGSK